MSNSLAHTKWKCKYHIVFTPKYRRKVIYNKYKESIVEIIKELCKWKGVEIIAGKAMVDHAQLLEKIKQTFPADRWLIIEDNLSTHVSKHTKLALAAWPEMQLQFIPKYACWLNLIEPWWKQLRSLAFKGRRFETMDELTLALNEAVDYWNKHAHPYVWKKRPQEQTSFLGGLGVQIKSDN